MVLYAYQAVTADGQSRKGLLDAANVLDLELHLKRTGLDLIDAAPDRGQFAWWQRKIRRSELIAFFLNLEQLTRSGVPLLDSLADLRDTAGDPRFREMIGNLGEAIRNGSSLSLAMAQHPAAFDNIVLSLVRAGEESGRLEEVFHQLTESLKWQDEMLAHSRTLILYPAFVGSVVLAVSFFLLTHLVPQLVGFITSMGQEIPLPTRMLLGVASILTDYWPFLLGTSLGLFLSARILVRISPALRRRVDRLKLRIWLIGPLLHKILLARFANAFALMYRSGISILDCIAHSRAVVNNAAVAASLNEVMREIEAGSSLTHSFQNTGMFPSLVIRMLKVGETTGSLDDALQNVSYFYERNVTDTIRKLQVMVEPTLTILLGALLGWVMLAVLAPIYHLIGRVQF